MSDPRGELQALLSEDPGFAIARAWSAFPEIAGQRRVVLVGAGKLGQHVAAAMMAGGMHPPLAFADNDRYKQGKPVAGLSVMSLGAAASIYHNAIFTVTIWGANSTHRIRDTEQELRDLGVTVVPFAHVLWAADRGMPHYWMDRPSLVLSDAANVLRSFDLLADDESRSLYVANIRARLTGRIDQLPEPTSAPAYLPGAVYAPRTDERVVDGGAFDGDTLRSWIRAGHTFDQWTAIEPHPINAAAFRRNQQGLSNDVQARVTLHELALDANRGTVRMTAGGGLGATRAAGPDSVAVDTIDLDNLAWCADTTLIKLDIEGAELQALAGMRVLVRDAAPVLAISAYHRQHHLWTVPQTIAAMNGDYAIYLRAHGAEGWDLVCYAVPAARRIDARAA